MKLSCPECEALLKQKDIDNDKCWRCGTSSIKQIIKEKEHIEVESKSEKKERKKRQKIDDEKICLIQIFFWCVLVVSEFSENLKNGIS